jgi:hypothetical protein
MKMRNSCIWHYANFHVAKWKINWRPLTVVTSYLYIASMLPSKVMFHTYMQSAIRRIRAWADGEWVDYFDREYLYRLHCDAANMDLVGAKCHYGLGNRTLKGHCPWPWPVEQSHGRLKRRVRQVRNCSMYAV